MPNGKWKAVATLPPCPGGKRRRRSRIANTRADAAVFLRELLEDARKPLPPVQRLTVAEYLDRWLVNTVKPNKARNTHESYRYAIKNHIVPRLGTLRLEAMSPLHVESFLTAMGEDEVGSRTRQNAFVVLRAAMNHAVHPLRLVAFNPCTGIAKPKHEPEKILPFSADESRQILEATQDDRLHAFYVLAFTTGMRQGEMFGLQWEYVDLKTGALRVEWQAVDISGEVTMERPKSKASIRTIELPGTAVAALRSHRAILLKEGHARSKLVFPAPEGGYMTRGNFRTRHWLPLLKSLGLADRGFHHTRHSYATLALGAGVPIHVLSGILGHARPSTTLNIYSHSLKSQQSEATARIEKLFG